MTGFDSRLGHCVVLLGKTRYSPSASLQPSALMGTSKLFSPEKKIDESVGVPCYILAFRLVEAIAIILVWVLIIQKTRLISSSNYNKRQGS